MIKLKIDLISLLLYYDIIICIGYRLWLEPICYFEQIELIRIKFYLVFLIY